MPCYTRKKDSSAKKECMNQPKKISTSKKLAHVKVYNFINSLIL